MRSNACGSMQSNSLSNGNQAAVLGVGGDGSLPGHPMTLNMNFDHRISGGREVALFLGDLRNRLLSYALPVAAEASEPVAPPGIAACDRCGIGLQAQYRDFPRDGYMLPYFRPDGTLGAACHRCWLGWV